MSRYCDLRIMIIPKSDLAREIHGYITGVMSKSITYLYIHYHLKLLVVTEMKAKEVGRTTHFVLVH